MGTTPVSTASLHRIVSERPAMSDPQDSDRNQPTPRDLNTMWSLHRLQAPTFDDLTKGLCLGLLWCMALWTPMFLSALS
ncbi:hypothetical protein J2847_001311 [Azospirillum agricola]|uniref:hypothetical protein n=1 Tax=Azospirillum agricola TaxID=1720247 RepID=UPI001AE2568D|nr:hypothetical protein [Azospirillum agricola]MBP2228029.1 hypothetical protein [Azospirillum agricola]